MSSYVALCLAMMTAGNDCAMHLFAHTFLVLSWVLVCRSVSTATINFAHIGASDDCILINLPRSKCDQDGDRAYERAVYANPFRPEVCPVLALALHVFTSHVVDGGQDGSPLLFGKKGAEGRFSEVLGKMMRQADSATSFLGLSRAEDIGTHSIRKGAASYLSSQLGGPSGIAIYQRAGWALGVQDRYLLTTGEDYLVGRYLSLLNAMEDSFASLPPHFVDRVVPFPPGHSMQTVLPSYSKLPGTFLGVLPLLVASLVYHDSWLRGTLPAKHP